MDPKLIYTNEYNLIIVGAGSAGIACAIRAAECGKRVLVIEKETVVGGTLHVTAGHLSGAGTSRQQAVGIADTPDAHLADIARISRNTMHPQIAEKAVALAAATIDWLEDKNYPFHERVPMIIHGHEPYQIPRTYFGKDDIQPGMKRPGQTVLRTLLPFWNKYLAAGLIDCRTEHRLVGMRVEGNQLQVLELNHQGNSIHLMVNQKPVVLTTGGYAANPDFFQQVSPGAPRLISTARASSTGDGIQLAMQTGAGFSGGEKHVSTLGALELEPGSGRADFWSAWARVSNGKDRKQREIYVNEYGHRFMNEYDLGADERERLVLAQPNRRFWIIFDEIALHDGDSLIPQWSTAEIQAASKLGKAVWQAASIAELAQRIGLPAQALEETVAQYNHAVAVQQDTQFGRTFLAHSIRESPFYAVLVYAYSLISFGGITVDENLRVLKKDGSGFDNLYAAGEILGAAATSGHAFCGGMLLTPALSFGKWLGEQL